MQYNKKCVASTIAISLCLVIAVVVGTIVWFVTRPDNIEVVRSTMTESSLSLVKVGNIVSGLEGTVRVDSNFLLENPQNVSYHLTINITNGYPEGVDVVDFHFSEDMEQQTVPSEDMATLVVKDIKALEFPHRLGADFIPSKWRGGVFVERSTSAVLGLVPFTIDLSIVADEDNDMIMTDLNSTKMMNMTNSTETGDGTSNSDVSMSDPVAMTPLPPPTLFSQLTGRGYRVGGSITVEYRTDFVDGMVVHIPVLRFQDILAPTAPGPFLYLTRRPNNPRSLAQEDIRVPIQGAVDGSFTVEGSFTQDFTFDVDLAEFTNGSWIVWCDPFRVHLGGGTISVADS